MCFHRALPADLVHRATGAASELAAGRTLAGAIFACALRLAARSKLAVLLLLVVCVAGAESGLTLSTAPADESPAAEKKHPRPAQPKPALDRHGDPLPLRAVARAGTV